MNFIEKLKDKWWSISFDERKGVQILFIGEFYIDCSAKVHAVKLSIIFQTRDKQKRLTMESIFTNMVELAGTAPASVGFNSSSLQV